MNSIRSRITNRINRVFHRESVDLSGVGWYNSKGLLPRAILHVSPAVQPNGVFVNYGDQAVYWAIKYALERRDFEVLRIPRTTIYPRRLKGQQPDIFLDLAGFIYSGSHHKNMGSIEAAKTTGRNAQVCRSAGAFAATAPQTFGPFSDQRNDPLVKEMARMIDSFDILYVRDKTSHSHLCKISPDAEAKLRIVPDTAFLYQSDAESGRSMLVKAGVDMLSGRPVAGIIPNRQISQRSSTYFQQMKRIIGFLRDEGAEVALIPHEHGRFGNKEKDDQYLCRLIAEETGTVSIAQKMSDTYPTAEDEYRYIRGIEDVISALDFLVAERFHGALRGLSETVPTVSTSWSHKYPQLYTDLSLSPDEFILGGEGAAKLSIDRAIETLAAAWRRRSQTRDLLGRKIPGIRNKVNQFVDEVAGVRRQKTG